VPGVSDPANGRMCTQMKFHPVNHQLRRVLIAGLSSLAVVTLVLLAAGLARVEFKPAQLFFSPDEPQQPVFDFNGLVRSIGSMSPGEALLFAVGVVLMLVLLMLALSPQARKKLIKFIIRMGLTAWAIYYALEKFRPGGDLEIETPVSVNADALDILVTPPVYSPPVIPSAILYLVSLVIVLMVLGAVIWIIRILRPSRSPLRDLARAARSTLRELSTGRNWEDSVISCYIRMATAVSDKRGLSRQIAMTPAEFAHRLEQAGIPSEPVRRLTRLFEKARYSSHATSSEDVKEAVACMNSILASIGETA
jgi:hypothetical protein